jgi:hypothetical protein
MRRDIDSLRRRVEGSRESEFPEIVEVINFPGTSGGTAPTASAGTMPADDTRSVIASVLGWRINPQDPQGFLAALTQAFPMVEFEGHQVARWNPRSYSVQALQAGMGSITGAQASIYARAKAALDQMLPLLDGLQPLSTVADPQDMEAIRAIIRPELTELVNELGAEGGPRVQRVDSIFRLLLKYNYDPTAQRTMSDPETVQGQLGELRDRFGLKSASVNTLEEEQNLTNFYILVNYADSLLLSWDGQRHFFDREGADVFFGTQMVLLSRALAVVAESVQELYFALDSVFLGPAERQILMLDSDPPLSIAELLSWIEDVTKEGIALMQRGGKDGVVLAFAPLISRIYKLVQTSMVVTRENWSMFPDGYRTPRVRVAISELASQLKIVRALALQIRHRPVSFTEVFPKKATIGDDYVPVRIIGNNLQDGSTVRLTKVSPPRNSSMRPDTDTLVTLSDGKSSQGGGGAASGSAGATTGGGATLPNDIEAGKIAFVNEREIYAPFNFTLPASADASRYTGLWNLVVTDPDGDFEYWKLDAFTLERAASTSAGATGATGPASPGTTSSGTTSSGTTGSPASGTTSPGTTSSGSTSPGSTSSGTTTTGPVTTIPAPPVAERFRVYNELSFKQERALLDDFGEALEQRPGASGYIFVHRGDKEFSFNDDFHASIIKGYLIMRGALDPDQETIVTRTAMPLNQRTVELWIVPSGATPPTPMQPR